MNIYRLIRNTFVLITIMGLISCVQKPSNYIGMVNNRPITVQEYNSAIRVQYEAYTLNTGFSPDTFAMRELMHRAWNNIVEGIVFRQQLEKFRITVTYEETVNHLLENVPELIKESRQFKENDVFDEAKYRQSLTEGKPIDLSWLISRYYEVELPKLKLNERLISLTDIPEREMRNEFIVHNATAGASVIHFPPESFTNIIVTDSEIRDYYLANRNSYAIEPYASLNYIIVKVEPSEEDISYTKTKIDSVHQELREGIDFRLLAEVVSDAHSSRQGGELPFTAINELPNVVRTSLEGISTNDFTRPFRTENGWIIYQLVARTQNLVRLREIYISHKASLATRSEKLNRLTNIRNLALEIGLPTAASEMSVQHQTIAGLTPQRTEIPLLGKSDSIVQRAINSPPQTIFEPLFRADLQSYILIEVEDSKSRGFKQLNTVSDDIKRTIFAQKQLEMSNRRAQEFYRSYKYKNILTQARLNGFPVYAFDSFHSEAELEGEQTVRLLAREMLAARKNSFVSRPVELDNGSYIGVVERFFAPDMNKFDEQRYALRSRIMEAKKETLFTDWMQEQVRKARVKDWRDKF